jgi:hypothetical protein
LYLEFIGISVIIGLIGLSAIGFPAQPTVGKAPHPTSIPEFEGSRNTAHPQARQEYTPFR